MTKTRISGFTIVRNATILDYPFRESVRSLAKFCDEVIINCGDSDDDTLSICEDLENEFAGKVRLIRSVWARENQKGGFQLKCQSDAALAECRGEWCVYLQADEVLHETDTAALLEGMKRADGREDVDGLVFDYLHFYGNFSYFMKGRNWYRREVRAFKNHRSIEAFRDAQGFRKQGKRLRAIRSGARVFHYGYVRSAKSMRQKSLEMAQWWGEKPSLNVEDCKLVRHVGLRSFSHTHPSVMQERIRRNVDYVDPSKGDRKWDRNELKNAVTLAWEAIFPFRIGEFRNYEIVG